MIEAIKLTGTTDGSGDLTVTATRPVAGLLHSVQWIDGDLADGVDAVLSVTNTDAAVDFTLLTLTDANNDAMYHPRHKIDDEAGADVTYDGTNEVYCMVPVVGTLQLVVSSGGASKTGGAVVYIA